MKHKQYNFIIKNINNKISKTSFFFFFFFFEYKILSLKKKKIIIIIKLKKDKTLIWILF